MNLLLVLNLWTVCCTIGYFMFQIIIILVTQCDLWPSSAVSPTRGRAAGLCPSHPPGSCTPPDHIRYYYYYTASPSSSSGSGPAARLRSVRRSLSPHLTDRDVTAHRPHTWPNNHVQCSLHFKGCMRGHNIEIFIIRIYKTKKKSCIIHLWIDFTARARRRGGASRGCYATRLSITAVMRA